MTERAVLTGKPATRRSGDGGDALGAPRRSRSAGTPVSTRAARGPHREMLVQIHETLYICKEVPGPGPRSGGSAPCCRLPAADPAGCCVSMALHTPREPSRDVPSPARTLDAPLPLTPAPLPQEQRFQRPAGTTPGPAASPMGASAALHRSHKLIHLYRAFARQSTYSPNINYAEPSVSHR